MNKKPFAWLILLSAVLVSTGCSTLGGGDEEGAAGGAQVEGADGDGARTSGMQGGGAWTGNPLDNPDSLLYSKVVYFDFDMSTIRPEFIDTLRAHAAFLVENSSSSVTIEGHCDERGSREYNIGLGERRANAVLRFFEAEGVNPGQINTISYGEERPADYGHDEAAWEKNRRAVLIY